MEKDQVLTEGMQQTQGPVGIGIVKIRVLGQLPDPVQGVRQATGGLDGEPFIDDQRL